MYVYTQLIHFSVEQKLTQRCNASILQLKKNTPNIKFIISDTHTFSVLCNHHHCLFQNILIMPRKESLYLCSPPRNPWQPVICFLSLKDFSILDVSFTQDRTVCGLWWLAYFTWPCVKVHLCCHVYQYFIPLDDRVFLFMDTHGLPWWLRW